MSDTKYTFAARPQGVGAGKKGYRQEEEQDECVNIMFDKRVFRGSTYSAHARKKQEEQDAAAAREAARRKAARARRAQQEAAESPVSPQHPQEQHAAEASELRDMDVQTDTYLEELTDRVPESEGATQTDMFMDRPSLPLFVPCATGVDAETQVDVDELFDFDAEVEPILEVLVGKTLEHAMMEVLEEEELDAIRKHQQEFEQERNVERAQVQRLEAEAVRRNTERQRRVDQEKERVKQQQEVLDKVAARAFAKEYLDDLHDGVFDGLMKSGHFYDPLIKEVEDQFLPWLISTVQDKAETRLLANKLSDALIRGALDKARAIRQARLDAEAARRDEERRAVEAVAEAKRAEEEAEAAAAAAEAEAEAAGEEAAEATEAAPEDGAEEGAAQ